MKVTIILTPAEQEICKKLATASGQTIPDVVKQAFKIGLLFNLRHLVSAIANLDPSKLLDEMNREKSKLVVLPEACKHQWRKKPKYMPGDGDEICKLCGMQQKDNGTEIKL